MKNNTMTITNNSAAYMPAVNPPSTPEEEALEMAWNDYLDAKQNEYDMFDRPVSSRQPWDI